MRPLEPVGISTAVERRLVLGKPQRRQRMVGEVYPIIESFVG
jgi:hypothetical protein